MELVGGWLGEYSGATLILHFSFALHVSGIVSDGVYRSL